jgi:hypothetical protein
MTSLLTSVKQSGGEGYYISVGSLLGKVFGIAPNGIPSTAIWAGIGVAGAPGLPVSTVSTTSGALLRDLGKTVVSSLRTFRKVQLVLPNNVAQSTFGVGGEARNIGQDYLTGYIELGFEGNGNPAPVAKFGR